MHRLEFRTDLNEDCTQRSPFESLTKMYSRSDFNISQILVKLYEFVLDVSV